MLCLEQEQQASDPEEAGKDALKDVGPATLSPPLLQEEPVFSVAPEKPFHVLALKPHAWGQGGRPELLRSHALAGLSSQVRGIGISVHP